MKKLTQDELLEVCRTIWLRSWGWPDGTVLCGMDSDRVNQAMEQLMDGIDPDWRNKREQKHDYSQIPLGKR